MRYAPARVNNLMIINAFIFKHLTFLSSDACNTHALMYNRVTRRTVASPGTLHVCKADRRDISNNGTRA